MKKIILFCLGIILLAGCVSTPNSVDIDATVQAAVSTALAPYEARLNDFVTSADLEASQNAQNQQLKKQVADQLELYRFNTGQNAEPTAAPDPSFGKTVDFSDNKVVPTDVPRTYKNDATCVDRFTYVSDMTIPDGMTITPYTNFVKSWYITNSGDCTWNSNYKLVYNSGAEVGKADSFPILQPGYFIQPGESVVVSADLAAPADLNTTFTTYWALESDRGEVFGAGDAKNVYLSSSFNVTNTFNVAQNFNSLSCFDDNGPIPCGISHNGDRGVVYYDETPMLESGRSGFPAIDMRPPTGVDDSKVWFEFGPLRFPRGTHFFTNFCCRPETPHCDVEIRLYAKELGYDWRLVSADREWNDGFMSDWHIILDDIGVFDQDFFYRIEIQTYGGSTDEDLIMLSDFRIY